MVSSTHLPYRRRCPGLFGVEVGGMREDRGAQGVLDMSNSATVTSGSGVVAEYIDTCSVSDAYAGWI